MRLQISDDVVFRELEGEAVILNLATGTYFGLDRVGTRIWQLIAEDGRVEKIVDAMLAEYQVDEGQLRRDLHEVIGRLREKGLITVDAREAPPAG